MYEEVVDEALDRSISKEDFFKEQNISGRDLLDVCEYLTFEKCQQNTTLVNYGDQPDCLYIVMDGKVNFFIDLKQYHLGPKETDELCHDLTICKKKFVK